MQLILSDGGDAVKIAPLCTGGIGIELQSFFDPCYIETRCDAIEVHQKAVSAISLRALHMPFWNLSPGSPDPWISDVTERRFEDAYDVGRKLGAGHFIAHHGYLSNTGGGSRWIARCTEFWQRFVDSKPGVNFHLENVYEPDPALLSDVVASINRPNVDVCLDIGHTECYSETSALEWIEQLGEQIGYVHLHNNDGKHDHHWTLDRGSIPMIEVCHALKQYAPSAIWAIEAETDSMTQCIEWLVTNGFLGK